MSVKFLPFFVALIWLATGNAVAQTNGIDTIKALVTDAIGTREGAWFSYRDSYKLMIRFEKYGGPKQFIQNHLQVTLTDTKASVEGMRLTLEGRSIHLNLPLDPVGRAVFPMLKVAYDENAELRVNRSASAVTLEQRVSIVTRPDGVYEVADLRAACDQVLQYQRYASFLSYRSKQCIGVQFAYGKDSANPSLQFRNVDHVQVRLPATEGGAFGGTPISTFAVAAFRFSDWPGKGQVISNNVPLAIAPIFD
jgi:hypothetical protein